MPVMFITSLPLVDPLHPHRSLQCLSAACSFLADCCALRHRGPGALKEEIQGPQQGCFPGGPSQNVLLPSGVRWVGEDMIRGKRDVVEAACQQLAKLDARCILAPSRFTISYISYLVSHNSGSQLRQAELCRAMHCPHCQHMRRIPEHAR